MYLDERKNQGSDTKIQQSMTKSFSGLGIVMSSHAKFGVIPINSSSANALKLHS